MKQIVAVFVCVAGIGFAHQSLASVSMVELPVPLILYDPTNGAPIYTPIDLNNDSETDFTFGHGLSLNFRTERANRVVIYIDPPPNLGGPVEVLSTGYLIGSSLAAGNGWASSDILGGYVSPGESSFAQIVVCLNNLCSSRMPATLSRVFLGIEFQLNGETHYGYFDVEGQHDTVGIIIHGWAWETQPNTPIIAGAVPEPGRGLLLLISLSTLLRRRRRALGSG